MSGIWPRSIVHHILRSRRGLAATEQPWLIGIGIVLTLAALWFGGPFAYMLWMLYRHGPPALERLPFSKPVATLHYGPAEQQVEECACLPDQGQDSLIQPEYDSGSEGDGGEKGVGAAEHDLDAGTAPVVALVVPDRLVTRPAAWDAGLE